ncbi:MAG TPA: hypothetical protein VL094_08790 [Sphingomonadaceae bacterium]|nr:hypothetical protein [Sphingomonadaceae bacterium]
MSGSWVSIIALLGWLVLAVSAYSGYRLGWRKSLIMALVWAAIFASMTVFIGWIGV